MYLVIALHKMKVQNKLNKLILKYSDVITSLASEIYHRNTIHTFINPTVLNHKLTRPSHESISG